LALFASWRLVLNKKPPSSARLDGGSLTSFVAQRSYPDLGLGFLLCFFCFISNVFIIFSVSFLAFSASWRFNRIDFSNKKPACPGGFVRVFVLSKPKIPDLDRAALLGFLGERHSQHDNSFSSNDIEFSVP